MLQHLSKRSTKLLLDSYNRVWTEGTFPSAWRLATLYNYTRP